MEFTKMGGEISPYFYCVILQLDAAGVADARVREERNVGKQRPERATFTDKNMQRKKSISLPFLALL